MRPIIKGDWPTDAAGAKIQFNGWGEAKPYLIDNTGLFCHFCEMKLDNTPAVEHVKPKALKHSPNLQNHWANLMLICDYCNSSYVGNFSNRLKSNKFCDKDACNKCKYIKRAEVFFFI